MADLCGLANGGSVAKAKDLAGLSQEDSASAPGGGARERRHLLSLGHSG